MTHEESVRLPDEHEVAVYLQQIQPYVENLADELLEVSHLIHERPEVRFEEEFASGLLADKLEEHGFAVERGSAGLPTAFSALASNVDQKATGAPTIAVFCEYDALEGIGHGCGHNIIGSVGIGAALATKRWLDEHPEAPGRLLVLGSPAEEGGGGKAYLIEAGYLEGIDAAIMIHPYAENQTGASSLAREALDVTFTGKPAHAAAEPHEGINALDAANLTLTAIGLLRQQVRPDSRIHSIVTDGGQATNVIPERASLNIYVRSSDTGYLNERLVPAVENCARGAALATGAEVEITHPVPTYASMLNNEVLSRLTEKNFTALDREVAAVAAGFSGSTDMGNVSHVVPSVHPFIRLVPGLSLHTKEAAKAAASREGDETIIDGALELSMTAVELYSQPELLSAAWAKFAGEV